MNTDLNTIIALIMALVIALVLHEYAHAWIGNLLGDTTAKAEGRLSLNPMAHIDPLTTIALPLVMIMLGGPVFAAAKPVPYNPWRLRWGRWGAALVALAGPVTNLILAIVLAQGLRFVDTDSAVAGLIFYMIVVNIGLFVFNMIPLPPLDGSRLLYAAVPPLRPLMDKIESAGIMVVLVVLVLAYPVISPFISAAVRGIISLVVPGGILL